MSAACVDPCLVVDRAACHDLRQEKREDFVFIRPWVPSSTARVHSPHVMETIVRYIASTRLPYAEQAQFSREVVQESTGS